MPSAVDTGLGFGSRGAGEADRLPSIMELTFNGGDTKHGTRLLQRKKACEHFSLRNPYNSPLQCPFMYLPTANVIQTGSSDPFYR